jgi:serine/threonine protein kinase
MAAPATTDEFLTLVRRSGLVGDEQLNDFVGHLQSQKAFPPKASVLAERCVEAGLLYPYQAEQLMQGRHRGFTLGKYRILERIGMGGMGQVYLCEHERMRRRVAVKVLPSAALKAPGALERFEREARAAASLDHPNIVRAFDLDQEGTLHFLVMEYVDGPTLYDMVRQNGPLDIEAACEYIRQAAVGLQHAHEAGLVHRDIKPSNILVDRAGTVKLLDLGLARFLDDSGDSITHKYDDNYVLGTADYVAPEQTQDSHNVDIRADIYSLGATFYFILAGRPPFPEGTPAEKLTAHQTKTPPSLQSLRHDVPVGVAVLIEKMMAKAPHHRFQTPNEVARALEAWQSGQSVLGAVATTSEAQNNGVHAAPQPAAQSAQSAFPILRRSTVTLPAAPPPSPHPQRRSAIFHPSTSGASQGHTPPRRSVVVAPGAPQPEASQQPAAEVIFPLYTPVPPPRSRTVRITTVALIALALGAAGGFGLNCLRALTSPQINAAKPAPARTK